jgi:ketoreductase RED1
MNETHSSDVLERYSTVAVIGAGVIGASWTAVFLAHGLTVIVK